MSTQSLDQQELAAMVLRDMQTLSDQEVSEWLAMLLIRLSTHEEAWADGLLKDVREYQRELDSES